MTEVRSRATLIGLLSAMREHGPRSQAVAKIIESTSDQRLVRVMRTAAALQTALNECPDHPFVTDP